MSKHLNKKQHQRNFLGDVGVNVAANLVTNGIMSGIQAIGN